MKKRPAIIALEQMGFKIIGESDGTMNGPDLWIQKRRRVYTVEIKKARTFKKGSTGVRPVESKRRADDLIAIEYPSGYVLIEPMTSHLKSCGPKGTRGTYPLT